MKTIRFLILITLLLTVFVKTVYAATDCAAQGDIPQAECDTLVAFYTSTNGADWSDSPGNDWNVTNTPCKC